jgi:hypothetical protein
VARNSHALKTGGNDGGEQAGRRQRAQGRGQEKRTQLKTRLGGVTAWTKRSKTSGEFMAVKKPAKKFKGVRREKASKKKRRIA